MSKLYYSSSEVSTMLDLEPSVLRFWEDQFGQLRIKRSRAGKRMYREKDIELIRRIKQLTRDEGYTIAGARKKLQESVATRSGAKTAAGKEKADQADQADQDPAKADHRAQQSERAADDADRESDKAGPRESASVSEVLQWIRTNLADMRKMMD